MSFGRLGLEPGLGHRASRWRRAMASPGAVQRSGSCRDHHRGRNPRNAKQEEENNAENRAGTYIRTGAARPGCGAPDQHPARPGHCIAHRASPTHPHPAS